MSATELILDDGNSNASKKRFFLSAAARRADAAEKVLDLMRANAHALSLSSKRTLIEEAKAEATLANALATIANAL
jgi:hypothetical protein